MSHVELDSRVETKIMQSDFFLAFEKWSEFIKGKLFKFAGELGNGENPEKNVKKNCSKTKRTVAKP